MSNYNMTIDKTRTKQTLSSLLSEAEEQERQLNEKAYRRGDSWKLGDRFLMELTHKWNAKPGDIGKRLRLLREYLKEENKELIAGLLKEIKIPLDPYGIVTGDVITPEIKDEDGLIIEMDIYPEEQDKVVVNKAEIDQTLQMRGTLDRFIKIMNNLMDGNSIDHVEITEVADD